MHPTHWLISTQVVAHAGVRWWAGRGKCDETNTLAKDRLFTINDEDFPQKACQLAALQFSAARRLLPRLDENGSYTFVVGDGADDQRSAPVWKSTSESGVLAHNAVLITESSGGRPTQLRHRAGVASMA